MGEDGGGQCFQVAIGLAGAGAAAVGNDRTEAGVGDDRTGWFTAAVVEAVTRADDVTHGWVIAAAVARADDVT